MHKTYAQRLTHMRGPWKGLWLSLLCTLSEKCGAGICCLFRAFKKKKTFLPVKANPKPICRFWIVVNWSDSEASYNQLDICFFYVWQGWGSISIRLLQQKAGTELRTERYMQTLWHLFSLGLLGPRLLGPPLLPTGISGQLWHASGLIRVGLDACAESCMLPSLCTVWCLSAMCCASCLLPLQS